MDRCVWSLVPSCALIGFWACDLRRGLESGHDCTLDRICAGVCSAVNRLRHESMFAEFGLTQFNRPALFCGPWVVVHISFVIHLALSSISSLHILRSYLSCSPCLLILSASDTDVLIFLQNQNLPVCPVEGYRVLDGPIDGYREKGQVSRVSSLSFMLVTSPGPSAHHHYHHYPHQITTP